MRYLIGTSGYNYPEWRGSFYPEKFPTTKMLAYYAERFTTVEVNYTFYRIPTPALLDNWAKGTPDGFTFTLKAPRRITHDSKLQRVEDLTQTFCRTAATLGSKLGVLLFQLPPTMKRDDAVLGAFIETLGSKLGVLLFQLPPTMKRDDGVLGAFIETLPEGTRAAFEFRHASWHDPAVFEALRRRNLALCVADSEKMSTPVVATADYGYFRLRDEGYQPADIEAWARTIRGLDGIGDAYVYFKHEEQGKGPEFAQLLVKALGSGTAPPTNGH